MYMYIQEDVRIRKLMEVAKPTEMPAIKTRYMYCMYIVHVYTCMHACMYYLYYGCMYYLYRI